MAQVYELSHFDFWRKIASVFISNPTIVDRIALKRHELSWLCVHLCFAFMQLGFIVLWKCVVLFAFVTGINKPEETLWQLATANFHSHLQLISTLCRQLMPPKLSIRFMYQSNRSFNIPPLGNPRAFEFFAKFLFKFPPPKAEKLFKCPIIGPFQVIKCPHPRETFR